MSFSFFLRDGDRGFPVLVLEDGPVFISEDPVPLGEFMSSLKALQSMENPSERPWGLKVRAEGGTVCLTLPDGRGVRVARKKLVETIRDSLKNLEAVLKGKPVRMEWLRFRLKPPSPKVLEMLGEPEGVMDEYEVQVYGSTYVLEAFVNLEGYVEELKELRDFVADGKLPGERWRVKGDLDGEIKGLSSSGLKRPEDRGLLRELGGLNGSRQERFPRSSVLSSQPTTLLRSSTRQTPERVNFCWRSSCIPAQPSESRRKFF